MRYLLAISLLLAGCRTLTVDELRNRFYTEVEKRREECFPAIQRAYDRLYEVVWLESVKSDDPALLESFTLHEQQVMDEWRALCR